jgi:hypothetical protein
VVYAALGWRRRVLLAHQRSSAVCTGVFAHAMLAQQLGAAAHAALLDDTVRAQQLRAAGGALVLHLPVVAPCGQRPAVLARALRPAVRTQGRRVAEDAPAPLPPVFATFLGTTFDAALSVFLMLTHQFRAALDAHFFFGAMLTFGLCADATLRMKFAMLAQGYEEARRTVSARTLFPAVFTWRSQKRGFAQRASRFELSMLAYQVRATLHATINTPDAMRAAGRRLASRTSHGDMAMYTCQMWRAGCAAPIPLCSAAASPVRAYHFHVARSAGPTESFMFTNVVRRADHAVTLGLPVWARDAARLALPEHRAVGQRAGRTRRRRRRTAGRDRGSHRAARCVRACRGGRGGGIGAIFGDVKLPMRGLELRA